MDESSTVRSSASMEAETSHAKPVAELRSWTRAEILWSGFYKDDEDTQEDEEIALGQIIAIVTGHVTLDEQEIVDEGDEREPNTPRYRIQDDLLAREDQVVMHLQWYLTEASKIVPGRLRHFRVDPADTLLPILKGASNPQQIRVAWDLLRVRIETGERFFKKYIKEAESQRMGVEASPVSTTESMLDGFDLLSSTEQRMKHFITYYPRHKESLQTAKERLTLVFSDWDTVHKRRSASASPERVEDQLDSPEFRLPGDDRHITRRGHRVRDSWPDDEPVDPREFGEDRTVFSPVPVESALKLIDASPQPSPTKPSTPDTNSSVLMKPSLKYKSSNAFLDSMANQSEVAIHLVPQAANEPNVLDNLFQGMAHRLLHRETKAMAMEEGAMDLGAVAEAEEVAEEVAEAEEVVEVEVEADRVAAALQVQAEILPDLLVLLVLQEAEAHQDLQDLSVLWVRRGPQDRRERLEPMEEQVHQDRRGAELE
ncbi:hypothetical protein C8R46DRAFT_1229279 [Mycena filopes]|nr:hypothetical protein C8R46DRAFT_1229279 [Mycena filopes]